MERTAKQMALIFKALSDENRIRILKLLHNGEMCACKLLDALNISQPTLSHHMKILCDAGIVNGRKEGKWMHYSICRESAEELSAMLRELLTAVDVPDCCCCKET
jgi:ArsR family transcriptional regulator